MWKYRVLVLGLTLIVGVPCLAVDDAKITKTVSRSFKVLPQTELEINNKYGDVIINDWDQDSVSIAITITAFGKDDEAAKRLIDRTAINFNISVSGIQVYTELSKSDGWIRDFWNELSGYSQTIISKDQLTIDFQVFMPSGMDLELTNKYGDVFLAERLGLTRVDLSNGNIKAEDVKGDAHLTIRYGNADINSLESANIILKSAELNLDQVKELSIQSNSSTVNLGLVEQAELNSRTDKIAIKWSGRLSGRTSFSKLRLTHVEGNLDMETNYGAITLERVDPQFTEVLIRGNSTDVELTFDHMAYFAVRIVAKEGKFTLPSDHGLKQVYTDGTEKFIKSTGNLGRPKSNPGEVNVDAKGGRVVLDFAPFEAQSNKQN
jgi:DUF4097 and DUF4098 domain-containing protein YvlB